MIHSFFRRLQRPAHLMRRAMGEMDRAHEEVRNHRARATGRRSEAERRLRAIELEVATLTHDAFFAISKDREDLARRAIARQLELEEEADSLASIITQARTVEDLEQEKIVALRLRRAQMQEELAAFDRAQPVDPNAAGQHHDDRIRRRVEYAEEAFEYAMKVAAESGVAGTAADGGPAVSGLDPSQRQAAIDERLAALKARATPSA